MPPFLFSPARVMTGLVQDPGTNSTVNLLEHAQCFLTSVSFHIDDHITNIGRGPQILRRNVYIFGGKGLVDPVHHPGLIPVNMQQPADVALYWQGDFRKIDGCQG